MWDEQAKELTLEDTASTKHQAPRKFNNIGYEIQDGVMDKK